MSAKNYIEVYRGEVDVELLGEYRFDARMSSLGFRVFLENGTTRQSIGQYLQGENLKYAEEYTAFNVSRKEESAHFLLVDDTLVVTLPIGAYPLDISVAHRPDFHDPFSLQDVCVYLHTSDGKVDITDALPLDAYDKVHALASEIEDGRGDAEYADTVKNELEDF